MSAIVSNNHISPITKPTRTMRGNTRRKKFMVLLLPHKTPKGHFVCPLGIVVEH
jgi:hypothetical protein